MTNPAPRPALRKADDAGVHPAAPRPARSPRAVRTSSTSPATAPEPAPAAEPAAVARPGKPDKPGKPGKPDAKGGKRKRKFGGATSDHLRVDPEPVPEGVASGTDAAAVGSQKRKPAGAGPGSRDHGDLMKGKQVDLGVKVPKALRSAAKDRAKAEGLDLPTVVIEALHAWVTRPPR